MPAALYALTCILVVILLEGREVAHFKMDAPQGVSLPVPSLSLDQQIALLPPDLQELVRGLPEDNAAEVLRQLVQATELSYRPLKEGDVGVIKARTAECSAYGFLSADVDITWEEISRGRFVAQLGVLRCKQMDGSNVLSAPQTSM